MNHFNNHYNYTSIAIIQSIFNLKAAKIQCLVNTGVYRNYYDFVDLEIKLTLYFLVHIFTVIIKGFDMFTIFVTYGIFM